MSYVAGDDVEIIQIHLGEQGENGPTVLSLCDEKKVKDIVEKDQDYQLKEF